ncbi:hypothetical protein [Bacteroides fluxus]|uniref:Uncharacterized protein n=1 Tax=Bacteroides fluxus YIT 12057 TaxID=763034 RepID=F3PWH1_9BACE|nr:hypothetical protein [Bacteroides fluxus]EGF52410.1 hypothetical protein HMPREF9446_02996 [Bacteroides fluxus YIT 12057]
MINRDDFIATVQAATSEQDYLQITRKYILHGIPYVFERRENDYFDFRANIAKQFDIGFHEVFIVGSAKLGFSYHKNSVFSLNSDIDVVIVNERLFELFYSKICNYQYDIEKGLINLSSNQYAQYTTFLKYMIKGWMRPDKLPVSIQNETIKDDWFNYFRSISNGKSSVGNYSVSGGLFKNYFYLEKYYTESLYKITS